MFVSDISLPAERA